VFNSPFPHHGPLDPAQVHGRSELVAELVARVTDHRPTVLAAPRRFGKTSVLGCLEAELAAAVTVVRADLYELRSWADFAGRLDSSLSAVTSPHRKGLDRIAAGLELNLGVVKATLTRTGVQSADVTADRLVDVLVAYAQAHPTVLIVDEFSSITRVDGAAGMLRTKLQHHYQRMGLVFAGSEPSTMTMLFTGVDQPFYGQADLIEVPPLSLTVLIDIVDDGFHGRPPARLAGSIHAFTGGHPQRSMQLADAAWVAVHSGTTESAVWAEALDACRTATASSHETRFAALTPADQAVMRLAAGNGAVFGSGAELLALSKSSAQHARRHLVNQGQVAVTGGRAVVVDPMYADWIRHRFPI
jgi:uncharacterized protein